MASPSLRNSGLATTAKSLPGPCSSRIACTRWAVPTGTVLLSTTTVKPVACRPMVRATVQMWLRSAEPSGSGGVPTAMKTTSAPATAAPTSVVKVSRPSAALSLTISSRPGS